MKRITFEDAQAMHVNYPDTFEVPPQQELDAIKAGDHVKVCVYKERFWVQVISIDGDWIEGSIDNDLVMSDQHGLVADDVIRFEKRHVYSIHTGK